MRVVRYWTERGIDGWRLDVPNDIDDDSFWGEFTEIVKGINPQAYTMGEIWDIQPRWVGDHHFDGLMHYPLRDAVIEFLNQKIHAREFSSKVEHLLKVYPAENVAGLFLLLGSHDTERIRTMLGGSVEKVKQAFLFLLTYQGVPSIYYGDEIGIEGGKDPDCRRAFPWEESQWNRDLQSWVRKLVQDPQARKLSSFWNLQVWFSERKPNPCLQQLRSYGDESILIVMNPTHNLWDDGITLSEFGWENESTIENLIGEGEYWVEGAILRLKIPQGKSLLLKAKGLITSHG